MTQLTEGTRIAGRYLLLRRLGLGGMGEVWLAHASGAGAFRRDVVLKCVAPDRRGDDRIEQMLADEARILGFLRHPGIVTALDFLVTEIGPVLVLDYVDGPSLRSAMRHSRKHRQALPEDLAVHIGAEVARALDAAHRATDEAGRPLNIVHRDVSPDNILLSRDGAVLLTDFGVAHAAGNSDVTYPGAQPKGKRGYMPPEQAAGRPIGPSADVFALGRVIAEASEERCGPSLRHVIDRATADLPADRFQTCADLAAALCIAVPPPAEPAAALAQWLREAAPESLASRGTSPGATTPSRRAFATWPQDPAPTSSAPPPPTPALFARVSQRHPARLRLIAGVGAAVALGLPLAHFVSAGEVGKIALPLRPGISAPTSELHIGSAPEGAEVYIDGTLRGVTPLAVKLLLGRHQLRVGSPRLERWRASEVVIAQGRSEERHIDLTE